MVEPKDRATDLSRYGEIMSQDAGRISLRVPRKEVPEVAAKLLADVPMFDLSVEEPPIEDVIERVYLLKDALRHLTNIWWPNIRSDSWRIGNIDSNSAWE